MREHYLIWIEDMSKQPRVAYTLKEAVAIGEASGYTFSTQFVNDYSLKSN